MSKISVYEKPVSDTTSAYHYLIFIDGKICWRGCVVRGMHNRGMLTTYKGREPIRRENIATHCGYKMAFALHSKGKVTRLLPAIFAAAKHGSLYSDRNQELLSRVSKRISLAALVS